MAPAGIGDRVEGFHAVAEAIKAGRVYELFIEQGRAKRPDVRSLVDVAVGSGVKIETVPSVKAMARTEVPQGLVANASPIEPLAVEDLAAAHRVYLEATERKVGTHVGLGGKT